MFSSITATASLAILQADHFWGVSQPVRTQWRRMQNPTSCLDDSDSSPHPIFPFKNCRRWAESSELVSEHESFFSPDCWLSDQNTLKVLSTDTRLLGYWLLSGKQLNLGSVILVPDLFQSSECQEGDSTPFTEGRVLRGGILRGLHTCAARSTHL